LYWKKFELEKERAFDFYNDGKLWLEADKPHPGKINFISKFPVMDYQNNNQSDK